MEINSIYDQFLAAQQAWPKNLCLRFEQKTWNYTQVLHEIDKAASKLVDLGVKKGDIVACSLPNCPESIYLFYAISKIGAISYNIHPLTTPYEMKTFIERSGAKFLIAIALNAEKFRRALKDDVKVVYVNPYRGVNLIKAIGLYFMGLHHKGLYYYHKLKTHIKTKRVIVNKEDDSVYLNTGGTNGRPKIARLNNVSINHLAKKTYPLLIDGKREKIKMLCAIPLFHGFGLAMGIHTPLTHGASTCLMLSFRTKMAIKHIRKAEATTIIGVPALYNALLSRPKFYGPHLKEQIIAFIGGDSVQTTNNSAYWQTNPDIMDVTNTYGTFTASFNTSVNGGGAMYQYYGSKAVPAGWLVPLTYINIGRQVSEDEEIAKVRLIVPHSQGHSDASSNVYPCFYEITYQEMRN